MATSAAEAPRNLFQLLPLELRREIISYIPRPTDLKALCLTCSETRPLAAEALYSSLTMKLDDKTLGNMYQIFNHKNPGIAYIDDIEIISDDMVTMRKFMTLLPRDQIEVLKFISPNVDYNTIVMIATTQRRVRVLEIRYDIDEFEKAMHKFDEMPWTTTLTHLTLDEYVNPDEYVSFLQACKTLKVLSIPHLDVLRKLGSQNMDDMSQETSVTHENVPCFPALEYLALRYASEVPNSFSDLIDFSTLTDLHLAHQEPDDPDEDFLLKSSRLFALRATALRKFRLAGPFESTMSLRDFLLSFKGLRDLYIDIVTGRSDYVDSLMDCMDHHAPSLTKVYIGPGRSSEGPGRSNNVYSWLLSVARLRTFCSNAVQLRQLGLCFPSITMKNASSGRWGSFGCFVDAVSSLPELRVLNIITWPEVSVEIEEQRRGYLPDSEKKTYQCLADLFSKLALPPLLDGFATDLMKKYQSCTGSCNSIPIISFGSLVANTIESGDLVIKKICYQPTTYLPSLRKDVFGREENYPIRVLPALLEYIEPDCDIVEYATNDCWPAKK